MLRQCPTIIKEEDLVNEATVIKRPRIKVEYKPDSERVRVENDVIMDEEKVTESSGPKIKLEDIAESGDEDIVSRDDAKKREAEERRRVKAEYKKIMSGAGESRKTAIEKTIEKVKAGSKRSASSIRKTKERVEPSSGKEDVEVGARVVKFDDGRWYKGNVVSLTRGKVGEVVRVGIDYDDNTKETRKLPDKDIDLLGKEDGGKERKKSKWGEVRVGMM